MITGYHSKAQEIGEMLSRYFSDNPKTDTAPYHISKCINLLAMKIDGLMEKYKGMADQFPPAELSIARCDVAIVAGVIADELDRARRFALCASEIWSIAADYCDETEVDTAPLIETFSQMVIPRKYSYADRVISFNMSIGLQSEMILLRNWLAAAGSLPQCEAFEKMVLSPTEKYNASIDSIYPEGLDPNVRKYFEINYCLSDKFMYEAPQFLRILSAFIVSGNRMAGVIPAAVQFQGVQRSNRETRVGPKGKEYKVENYLGSKLNKALYCDAGPKGDPPSLEAWAEAFREQMKVIFNASNGQLQSVGRIANILRDGWIHRELRRKNEGWTAMWFPG